MQKKLSLESVTGSTLISDVNYQQFLVNLSAEYEVIN